MVTRQDLERAFDRLGLTGASAVLHSSLRSLGRVEGGADAVVAAITATFENAVLPAFTFESNAPPPPGDRPARNGCDYAYYEGWTTGPVPFRIEHAGIDRSMGVVPRRFASLDQTVRSDHAWHSWLAHGPDAGRLLRPHPWDTTNLPLDRLAAANGFVVLIGVGLTSCTAVHVAEERAGRRPFVRWAWDRDAVVRRIRVAGCSKGFGKLEPYEDGLFREATVGDARIRVAPLRPMIDHFAEVIRRRPEITVCSEACLRCRDSMQGGPPV